MTDKINYQRDYHRLWLDYREWLDNEPVSAGTPSGDAIQVQGAAVKGYAGNDFIVDGANIFFNPSTIDPATGRATVSPPTYYGADGGESRLSGGAGDDVIVAGDEADRVYAGPGDDLVFGDAVEVIDMGRFNRETPGAVLADLRVRPLREGAGDDELYGGPGADAIYAGHGDDHVQGGPGNDWLVGGAGDDRLVPGDAGFDFLHGGSGRDTFDLSGSTEGVYVILDFDKRWEGDKILLPEGSYSVGGVHPWEIVSDFLDYTGLGAYGVTDHNDLIRNDWGAVAYFPDGPLLVYFPDAHPLTIEHYGWLT